jgi:WhiB family redox-sensing transcriptional regulator
MSLTTRRPTTRAARLTRRYDWRDDAACARTDPETFFPQGQPSTVRTGEEAAKRICAGCFVAEECLAWALNTGQHIGVWGGLTADERRGLSAVPERTMDRCMNAQAWIEEQLAAEVPQRDIAAELGVDRGVLCRAIQRFRDERAQGAAAGEVQAA